MSDDLARMSAALRSQQIPFVVIKGGALLALTSGTLPWRHTEDLDVVVAPGLVELARRTLLNQGFDHADIGESVTVDGQDIQLSVAPDHHAEFPLRAPGGTMIDLHRSLPSSQHRLQAVLRAAHDVPVWGVPVPVPRPTHQLTILSEHVWFKHRAAPESLARHLHDARVLLSHGAVARDPASTLTLAILDALHQDPDGRVARLAIPDPQQLIWRQRFDAFAEQSVRLQRNLRWSPAMLARKIVPAESWMDEQFGPASTTSERLAQHATRWKFLIRRVLRGPS